MAANDVVKEATPEVAAEENTKEEVAVKETTKEEVAVKETTKEEVAVKENTSEAEGKTEVPAEKIEAKNGEEKVDETLKSKILTQIEYYFGDFNLPRDKFLQEEIKKDEGWVPLTTMLKFSRLAQKTKDASIITAVIREAKDSFMEVDAEGTKIRRSVAQPAPELDEGLQEESIGRTIYVKGFPKDGSVTLDDLLEFFKAHGDYDSVRMRNYHCRNSQVQGFKGSVLVVFKTPELAKAFIEGPPTQHQQTYLIKKWFKAYLEEKKQEAEERRAKKEARHAGNQQRDTEIEEMPKGTFLKATGFTENTMREDIKAAVFDLTSDCAFVDFKKGDDTAFIRLSEAGSNVRVLEAIKDSLKVNEAQISLALVEGEEEEALLEKAKEARRRSQQQGGRGNKRKGGWGQRGGRNKRQRN